jgi:hypothetical protein
MTKYAKEDDYTLRVTNDLPDGGQLCRYFNFAAEQITTVFSRKEEIKIELKKEASDSWGGNSHAAAASVALTSQMNIEKFSDLDSQFEVELMREKLISLKGQPPAQSRHIPGKAGLSGTKP